VKAIDIILWLFVALPIGIVRGIICGAIEGLIDELSEWWALMD
jgi:ABC-type dipeptide/oligopeptide/nickel transport system permease subunit